MIDPSTRTAEDRPEQLSLGEIVARLKTEDPDRVLPVGFAKPHSYRGDYYEVAFEIRRNITVGAMLAAAESAIDATFQGWKGGDYKMSDYSCAWLVAEEGDCGETIGAVSLELMLDAARAAASAVREALAREVENRVASLRAGFPDGPGDDTVSYLSGIETAARLIRKGDTDHA